MLALITEKLQTQTLDDVTATTRSAAGLQLINPGRFQFTQTTSLPQASTNKNVWTVSFEGSHKIPTITERSLDKKHDTSHDTSNTVLQFKGSPPPILCAHNKPVKTCYICAEAPNTPTPPKKKHCRSLSIPGDTLTRTSNFPSSDIWKPINFQPAHPANIAHTALPSHIAHITHPANVVSHSNYFVPSSAISTSPRTRHHSVHAIRHSSGKRTPSGKITPSDSGKLTPSEYITPPESPIPRPASVSFGYTDRSFSPIGAPWLDAGASGARFSSASSVESFHHRSLSYEEKISHSTGTGSVPSIISRVNSLPSSPRRPRIARCRSQPCVLHERRCGVKRRRECDRPTLDFKKMTETAYDHTFIPDSLVRRTEFQQIPSGRTSRFHEELESAVSLVPIASSPLDSDIPIRVMEAAIRTTEPGTRGPHGRHDEVQPGGDMSCDCGDEDDTDHHGYCRVEDDADQHQMFPIADLDLDEIESH